MDASVLLRHLASLEEESATLYQRLKTMTFLVPRVSELFDRLSREEMMHRGLIELVMSYHSQAEGEFDLREHSGQELQGARDVLNMISQRIRQAPPRPPFLDILEDVLEYEKTLEGRHYETYLEIKNKEIKDLLLQLNQYDQEHVRAITDTVNEVKKAMTRDLQQNP